MPETEPALVTRTLTCHTEGCENVDLPITLSVPEDVVAYACGPCGQPIEAVE